MGDIAACARTFAPAELARTRREIAAQIDEARNDDRALCARFFTRNLYGDHPYGHAADGTPRRLDAATAGEVAAHFRKPLRAAGTSIFAATGDVDAGGVRRAARARLHRPAATAAPPPDALELRTPVPLTGWRIQLVDKPDRQQTQLMFGHAGLRADRPGLSRSQVGARRLRRATA